MIPGIDPETSGTSAKDQDTAIYLLQTLHRVTEEQLREDEFVAAGGREVSLDDVPNGGMLRGTVVYRGFYSGGTGWQQWDGARLMRADGNLYVLPKGKRTNGNRVNDGRVLILEAAR